MSVIPGEPTPRDQDRDRGEIRVAEALAAGGGGCSWPRTTPTASSRAWAQGIWGTGSLPTRGGSQGRPTRCAPAPGRRHIAAGPPAGLSSDLPKVETNGKPGRQASRSTRGTCVARRTDRIRMVAAMADATAAMAHAAIEAARPGLFVIKYSNATTWDEPKKTE